MVNIAILTACSIDSHTHQGIPEQFLNVDNKAIIIYTLEAFQQHSNNDKICVVIFGDGKNIMAVLKTN